ncbi:peptidoglycan DD-metalloendopeptidase family protein [Aliikangiella sp. GXAS 311]|uniref:Peptidoglycan DD-metalloendopeptidase family protein n=2 Tax=Aliikangiella maris TaxID=3162458 RepID=A0ABV3MIH4_9GAMM
MTFLFTALIACSNHAPAPVYDLYSHSSPTQKAGRVKSVEKDYQNVDVREVNSDKQFHLVKPGDTLFSIAWYYARDHEELASINHIKNNIIYPGQRIYLQSIKQQPLFDPESLILALNKEVLKKPVELSPKNTAPVRIAKVAKPLPATRLEKSSDKTSITRQNLKKSAKVNIVDKKNRRPNTYQSIENDNSINWIWPTEGKILNRFSAKGNTSRGLDIAASKGQPVRATAPGRVVYEGNGLRGYGNLVIIKHNNNYLSAYAHNHKVHVSENEFVNAGQRIAEVGSSGTHIDKLHFEIRYKGKPVDPLNYLPKKNY